jgi:predicted  nucleic acid-binding Zn-ribbon protein
MFLSHPHPHPHPPPCYLPLPALSPIFPFHVVTFYVVQRTYEEVLQGIQSLGSQKADSERKSLQKQNDLMDSNKALETKVNNQAAEIKGLTKKIIDLRTDNENRFQENENRFQENENRFQERFQEMEKKLNGVTQELKEVKQELKQVNSQKLQIFLQYVQIH